MLAVMDVAVTATLALTGARTTRSFSVAIAMIVSAVEHSHSVALLGAAVGMRMTVASFVAVVGDSLC